MFPEYAEINGKEYKLNTDYMTALECFEIAEDETITDQERSLAIIYLLFGLIPNENLDLFLEKAVKFLQCGETDKEQNDKKRDMDFSQDKKYIIPSFKSDYGIDLDKEEDMHFWKYIYLIQGLTEYSALNRIRDLRNYDESKITDPKERDKIIKAKNQVMLKVKLTEEEKRLDDLFVKQMKGE